MLGVLLNAVLIAFNLLPIPPLDGSHVFKYLLPRPLAAALRAASGGTASLVLILLLQLRRARARRLADARVRSRRSWRSRGRRPSILPTAAQWLR